MKNQKSGFSGEFHSKIEKYRNRINSALSNKLTNFKNSLFHEPLKKALEGGKRIRPIILVLSYECSDGKNSNPYPAATAVEFAHLESLIHDDLIDQDMVRRESESFHVANRKDMAILSADFILSIVLEVVSYYDDFRIPKALSRAASEMSEGELEEVNSFRESENLNLDRYLEIIRKKTAVLFEVSAELGAIIGDSNQEDLENLSRYGSLLGMSYQIEDDLSDLERGEQYNILNLLDTDSDFRDVLREKSKDFVEEAKETLDTIEADESKDFLLDLADFARPH